MQRLEQQNLYLFTCFAIYLSIPFQLPPALMRHRHFLALFACSCQDSWMPSLHFHVPVMLLNLFTIPFNPQARQGKYQLCPYRSFSLMFLDTFALNWAWPFLFSFLGVWLRFFLPFSSLHSVMPKWWTEE